MYTSRKQGDCAAVCAAISARWQSSGLCVQLPCRFAAASLCSVVHCRRSRAASGSRGHATTQSVFAVCFFLLCVCKAPRACPSRLSHWRREEKRATSACCRRRHHFGGRPDLAMGMMSWVHGPVSPLRWRPALLLPVCFSVCARIARAPVPAAQLHRRRASLLVVLISALQGCPGEILRGTPSSQCLAPTVLPPHCACPHMDRGPDAACIFFILSLYSGGN